MAKKFTIQNVSIKYKKDKKVEEFVENLQYKMFLLNFIERTKEFADKLNLQYKMFLLNCNISRKFRILKRFTIQNVSIKSNPFNVASAPVTLFTIQNVSIKSKRKRL